LLKAFFKASQGALGSRFKENLGAIATALSESAEENVPRNVEETGAASRERMAGAKETMQQRVEESKDDLQKHVTEELTSAAKDGAQDKQCGRPASGWPPAVAPSSL
jgi:F0F1-type ATP synthase membrane subunit b/b'